MPVLVRAARGPDDRAKIYALRNAVFVGEQRVPEELERDEHDASAQHVIALADGGQCVGTGRLVAEEVGGGRRTGRVGRMAVHPMWRGRGIGRDILRALEAAAREKGLPEIHLHAQVQAEPFYAREGYGRAGPVFDEAGIEHVSMTKALG